MAKNARPIEHDARAIASCPPPDQDLDRLRTAISGIRFGEVRVIIHDGVIVQIDRIEKQRLH